MYRIAPISRDDARAFVARTHRHLPPPVGDMFRVSLVRDDKVVGVGIAGRPVARGSDDGATIEIIRVAVIDGVDCGCSRIYGALRKAAVALGYDRVITYTLAEEPGTSLRAAGFARDGETKGGDWSCDARKRGEPDMFGNAPKRHLGPKVRWVWRNSLHAIPPRDIQADTEGKHADEARITRGRTTTAESAEDDGPGRGAGGPGGHAGGST